MVEDRCDRDYDAVVSVERTSGISEEKTQCGLFGRTISITAVLVSLAGMAPAADIRLLSVGAVQNAVRPLAADFSKDTGHKIVFTVGSPAVVAQKIKDGEIFDAVIVAEPAMDGSTTRRGSSIRKAGCSWPIPASASRCARARRRTAPPPTRSSRYCWRRSRWCTAIRRCPTRAAKGGTDPGQGGNSRRAEAEAADRSGQAESQDLIASSGNRL